MSRRRIAYVSATAVLVCAWVLIFLAAPDGSFWDTLSFPIALALGLVLIPALFGPPNESLKRWQRD